MTLLEVPSGPLTLACEHCDETFVVEHPVHPGVSQRYCSNRCRAAVSREAAVAKFEAAPFLRACAGCGTMFEPQGAHRRTRYCSNPCRAKARAASGFSGNTHHDPEPSPLEWDGETRFNDLPRSRDYLLECMFCGSLESLQLTDSELHAKAPQYCGRCHGRMFLAPEDAPTRRLASSKYEEARA